MAANWETLCLSPRHLQVFLYYNYAVAHSALSIHHFLAKKNISLLEQPPYLPDHAPSNVFLFLEGIIKGTHFEDMEAIKRARTMELMGIREESFKQCTGAWQRRMYRHINYNNVYL